MGTDQRVIALMGATATGKTALGMQLAQHFPIEIISVDSALIYRDMDIGTAKPSPTEQMACPHHLIDILTPLQRYSAAQFCEEATALINAIHARGRIPLLLGGTLLYFKALQQGLAYLPQADLALRTDLDNKAAQIGWPAMHQQLTTLDPETAARLQPTDSQRIQRALEVYLLTGLPMSHFLASQKQTGAPFNILSLALVPTDRSWLHERITLRFNTMVEQGLLDEVVQLQQNYPSLSLDLPSMRCVGYRQAWEYLAGCYGYQTFIEKGTAATRQLAKRQLTWIRSLKADAIDAQSSSLTQKVIDTIEAWLPPAHL